MNQHRNGVPLRKRDVFFVESPKAKESILYTVYSVGIEGVYTHWDGRTCPCYEDHSKCEPEHSLLNIRWKGYLFGYSHKRNEAVFAQLTLEAANQLMDQVEDGTSLRGLKITLIRSDKNKGRLCCRLESQHRPLDQFRMPPIVDPRRSLFNLWELEYNDWPFTQVLNRDEEDGGLKLGKVV